MKSIADINAIRDNMKSKVLIRDNSKDAETHVFVAMGTCGLKAGSCEVFNAFVDEITSRGIKNVRISRSGCMGKCEAEPMAQVVLAGGTPVTYVNLNADKVKKIVESHIINGCAVEEYQVK